MNSNWWKNAVVYQVYPRSFYDTNGDGIGDIAGVIAKLDYLALLGIEVIWLSPVYESPMDDNGYDISDYQAIAEEFGTLEDMKRLLSEAKIRGIRVIMDLVVNHTSDEHAWFKESRKSKDNPFRDFYIWRDAKQDGSPPDEQGSIFGGSAWQWDEHTQQYYFHLFSKKQPDLNWENPKVQTEVHNMMNWWIELGIGGFRLDVIDLIGKEIDKGITGNGSRLHPLLKQMNQATFGDKDLLTVGETWGATPDIAKLYSAPERDELSMVFQFEHITLTWQDGDKWTPSPFNVSELKRVLFKWQTELEHTGWNSLFWNNHDLPRVVSKYGNDTQYRVESAKMLATTLHFMKGTPYIYQGEEIGMTNVSFDELSDYKDIETLNFYKVKTEAGKSHDSMLEAIHENSRDNARTPMQWTSARNGGFTEGEPWLGVNKNYVSINVEETLNDPHSIFYHYQNLIALRKSEPCMVDGGFTPLFENHKEVLAYIRHDESDKIYVFSNFAMDEQTLTLPDSMQNRTVICLSSNYQPIEKTNVTLSLKPYETLALKLVH